MDTQAADDQIKKAADLICQSRRIAVFTGAGVSTSCGIPDFRGPRGLYTFVQEKYDLPSPEAIFEIHYFKDHPGPFFDFARGLDLEKMEPSPAHRLIAALEKKGQIALTVTQNIDRLHEKAGSQRVLACHGTFERGRCLKCGREYGYADFADALAAGEPPLCSCSGIIKPDVVFFGEQLPREFLTVMEDPPAADLLLVMGTSLSVMPASLLPLQYLRRGVPSILVNREPTDYDGSFSQVLAEDTDAFARKVADCLHLSL